MSKYILKLTGSNEIVSIIEWDGVAELSFPSLYELEPFVTSSTDFILNPTSSIDAITNYVGVFDGDFVGNLSGSVTINGQSFNDLIHSTKYGYLKFISGSDIENQGLTPSFIIDNFDQPTNIILPLDNQYYDHAYDYSGSLNRILNNNGASNIIKFKNILDTSKEMQFLINGAEITGSNVSLNVSEVYNSFYNDIYFDTTQSNALNLYNRTDWYVDFDLGDKAQSGKFYGDFIGNVDITSASMDTLTVSGPVNISDSLVVNGSNVLNPISANYGRLKFDAYSYDVTDECTPKNYFRFDRDAFGLDKWNEASPEKIALSMWSISDYIIDIAQYRNLMVNIVQNRLQSVIKLSQVLVPTSYKIFKILNANIYLKQFRQDLPPLYYKMAWGMGWELLDMEIVPDLRFDELPSLDPNSSDNWYQYIELDVIQIETSRGLTSAPSHDDEFSFTIETSNPEKRKEVFEFTSTTNWTVPCWADKLTIYAIGAGGGGGAGAVGWGHSMDVNADNRIKSYDIGFEFATGGGGGAGGNIAISEFYMQVGSKISTTDIGKTKLPKCSELTIYIGAGGSGGQSLSSSDLRVAANGDDHKFIIDTINDNFTSTDSFPFGILVPVTIDYWKYMLYQKLKYESMGKDGSASYIYLKKSSNLVTNESIKIIQASGGLGGTHGFSFQVYKDYDHEICTLLDHHLQEIIAPGGGSTIRNSFGNNIRLGGHGGYGVSMAVSVQTTVFPQNDPAIKNLGQDYWTVEDNDPGEYTWEVPTYHTTRSSNFKKLCKAPNIPWSKNSDIPALALPYGTTDEKIDLKGYKKTSYNTPNEIAPLGGSGGLGFAWGGLNHRTFAEDVGTNLFYVPGETTVRTTIPSDFYQKRSEVILNEVEYDESLLPRIIGDNTLVSTTRTNGSVYTLTLLNEGAAGGFNSECYKTTDGNDAELPKVPVGLRQPATIPDIGRDIGQGGGGGAAAYTTDWNDRNTPISSQAGGGGSNGFVVIIAEQL